MDLRTITRPLYEAKTWIKFLGGALVGIGVFYALTIVGLVIAWLFSLARGVVVASRQPNRQGFFRKTTSFCSLVRSRNCSGSSWSAAPPC